jgi:2-polyprenyl-3-methyl-5-hydroxy-6-metoxy-1,4-benzoquinol methylase
MTEDLPTKDFDAAEYWENRLTDSYTLGATGWSGLGESFNRWSYSVRKRVFARAVRETLGDVSSLRVLDVGSGTGFYLDAWRRLGVTKLVGSDLTAAAVARLTARYPDVAIHKLDIGAGDGRLEVAAFDVISIIDVLYHIVDDERYEQAIANLAAMLKPGGTLLLTENFVGATQIGRHQINRTEQSVRVMLESKQLSPAGQWPVFFLMNTPVSSQSQLLARWWRLAMRIAGHGEAWGWTLGAALFPVEVALGRVRRDGPSTKLAAWRRDGAHPSARA